MLSRLINQVQTSGLPELEFARPAWLLLLPLLWVSIWLIARRSLAGWRGIQPIAFTVLRCAVVTLLVAILADPSVRWTARDVALMVVRDVSRSIPPEQQKLADEFMAASAQRKRATDRVGLITAARLPMVQSLPVAGAPWTEIGHVGETERTNLQRAVELAGAVLPPDAGGRLLLISDGNQTEGSLAAAATFARSARVPVDVAVIEYERRNQLRLREIIVPSWARAGETINARIVVEAAQATRARLGVLINGVQVDLDPARAELGVEVSLSAGANAFTLPLKLTDEPSHTIEAFVEPNAEDSTAQGLGQTDAPELRRATGVTFTSTAGRVLLLSDDAVAANSLRRAISTEGTTIEVRASSEAQLTPAELVGFDAIILANQPAFNFSQVQQEQLRRFVHDGGGGLIVTGGPDSFGAGGWIGSPLADAYPVVLDPPRKREMPMGALALIIDCSGSMSAAVSGTGMNQQQIANEAAILGVRALSRLDEVTVIAFSGSEEVIVPLTKRSNPEGIARQIRNIGPDGGTNLFPAIDAAADQLSRSNAGVKHIIILTDGDTIGAPVEGIERAGRLKRLGVSISTVAIGDQINSTLLKQLAAVGGGRYHQVQSVNAVAVLPQIFIKEARTVSRTLIWEGVPFQPTAASPAQSLRGMSGPFPAMRGYVVTGDRGGLSSVPLRGPHGDPILAQWQYGLGRVTVFTSDAAARWSAPWLGWSGFAPFWQQQLRWTMRPVGDPSARVSVAQEGDRARMVVDLLDAEGSALNFAQVRGRVLRPVTASDPLAAGRDPDLVLRQVGPGRYVGEIDTPQDGVYIASIQYRATGRYRADSAGGGREGSIRAAVIRQAGDEMRAPTPDRQALWQLAQQTNGRIFKLDSIGADLWSRDYVTMPQVRRSIWLVLAIAAMGMFLADVAARRVAIDRAMFKGWWLALVAPARVRGSGTSEALARVKARTARSVQKSHPQTRTAAEPPRVVEAPRSTPTDRPTPPSGPAQQRSTVVPPVPPVPPAPSEADRMDRLKAAKRRSSRDD